MKKNVLFVISGIAYSGAEKVLEDYIDHTNAINPFFVFYFPGTAYEKFKEKYKNVFLMNLKYNRFILAFFPNLYNKIVNKKLKFYVKDNDIQKVFFNNTLEGLLGYKYIRNYNESIYEIHDMSKTFKIFLKRYMIYRTIRICNNTVTVSNACCNSWKNKIKYVVYNGMSVNDERYLEKENIVTYIGNSTYRKGSDVCINTAKNVIKADRNIKFYMIFGDKIPNYEYPDNVITLCNIDREKVYEILKISKILFLPARNDPFPTVILEGQQYDNVIVANCVDGIPEMVPTNKFLSMTNSVEDYVNYILNIISMNSAEFNNNVENQREFIKKFDINDKVEKFDNLILK